ncbi:hypothetical protein ACFJIX_17925 [Roseateles sp. UC29_93]|uniref:hypothetical protein n=1 Tax=Roseateles sp. UC29_93 TaxID=3350177 RepID=UPI00366B0747
MKKAEGIGLLGGVARAAIDIGISESAVRLWPDPLTPAIRDRVQAALYRRQLAEQERNVSDVDRSVRRLVA